jgi:hypothetical protein
MVINATENLEVPKAEENPSRWCQEHMGID